MDNELRDLHKRMEEVHGRVDVLFKTAKIPTMLMSEYKNKVDQYENMFDTVETMKKMVETDEAVAQLFVQQKEILNKRIKCELELARKAQSCI